MRVSDSGKLCGENVLLRFYIFLFTVSVSTASLAMLSVPVYGLFGEVASGAVQEEGRFCRRSAGSRTEISGFRQSRIEKVKRSFGIIYNSWFLIAAAIIVLVFMDYGIRLPRSATIVSLQVRMDC